MFEVPEDEASDYGKVCTKCKEWWFWESYSVKLKAGDGLPTRCRSCLAEDQRNRRIADPAQNKKTAEKSRFKNRDKNNARSRERNANGAARATKYRITVTMLDYMHTLQKNCCAWCGKHESELFKKLRVDHDRSCCPEPRSCGKCVRRLLCDGCNTLEGSLKVNWPEGLALRESLAWMPLYEIQLALNQFRLEEQKED